VCADACFAPCEEVCAYKQFGDPSLSGRSSERPWTRERHVEEKKEGGEEDRQEAAIVGAGPAGLTAAYYLATKGHEVKLFDSFPKPGGMLRYGIPNYVCRRKVGPGHPSHSRMGVKFQGNTTVGKDISWTS